MANYWTIDEVTLALYAYCHVPFNKASNSNPWIVKIANIIGRSPAAVKMKIGNLGVFDPELKARGIVGLTSTSKVDEIVWNRYYGHWDALVEDAERLIVQFDPSHAVLDLPEGSDQYVIAKRRLNQQFFRDSVLTAYNASCCITNMTNPTLLEACHITSWSEDEAMRTDPSNGLCLNSLLHKAYDNHLISVTPDYEIRISERFLDNCKDDAQRLYYKRKHGTLISTPSHFFPYRDCLDQHHQKYLTSR